MAETPSSDSGRRPIPSETLWTFAAIVAISAITLVLTTYRLGARDVCSGNEAVEGVFVQQMVEHGKLLFPLENGHVPMYKPPLFHWTATAIDLASGRKKVTAFNLRLPSALYAVAGVIVTMLFAYDLLGLEAAILAGLTLAGSFQYITLGRFGRVDMTLAFYEALALFAFFWWIGPKPTETPSFAQETVSEPMQYFLAIALGLAVLAKGPVGALLPLAAMGIFVLMEGRLREAFHRVSIFAIVLALAIGASWYIACWVGREYGFLARQIGSENFGRFFGSLGAMSPLYYVFPILFNSGPLSVLVPIAVVMALRSRPSRAEDVQTPAVAAPLGAVRLFAIFWIVTLVFFSIAAYKRRAYLLPLWPPSAVMLAWMVMVASERFGGIALKAAYGAVCLAMIVVNLVVIPQREARECGGDSFRVAATEIAEKISPTEPIYLYGFSEEVAPLLFYLDRDAPEWNGKLGDAPPGYIIVPAGVWAKKRGEALDLEPVLESHHGNRSLIVLHRGKVYADIDATQDLVWSGRGQSESRGKISPLR
jgi:4-amino-4-deoxy-L-arabinose transferase-like glycosyltransferase